MASTKGKNIGYARELLCSPSLEEQVKLLKQHKCWNIWQEARPKGRRCPQLELALADLRPGDVFVVASVLCVSLFKDFRRVLETVQHSGAHFRSLDPDIDSRAPNGHAAMAGLLLYANLKRAWRSEATLEGLAKARRQGRTGGRPVVLSDEKRADAQELIASGQHSMADIAKRLGVARSSLYNAGLTAAPKTRDRPVRGGPKVGAAVVGSTTLQDQGVR